MERFTVEEKNNVLEIFDILINQLEKTSFVGYKRYLEWLKFQKEITKKFPDEFNRLEFTPILISDYINLIIGGAEGVKSISSSAWEMEKKCIPEYVENAAGLSIKYLFLLECMSFYFLRKTKYGIIKTDDFIICTHGDVERLEERLSSDNNRILETETKNTYLTLVKKTQTEIYEDEWYFDRDFIDNVKKAHIEVAQIVKEETRGAFNVLEIYNPNLYPNNYTTRSSSISSSSSGCYIATACYGNYDAVQVLTFRHYRDEYLSQSILGRLFIRTYYALSPSIAKWLVNKHKINNFVREKFLESIYKSLKDKY